MSDILRAAFQAYQSGDYARALGMIDTAGKTPAGRTQELSSLKGNTLIRLGRMLDAAEAFAAGSALPGPNAAMLAKFAIGLYSRAGARRRIVEFGARAVALNPGETALLYDYAAALFEEGRYHEAAAAAGGLDRANPQHFALMVNVLRLTGQFGRLSEELEAACARDPGDMLAAVSRMVVARETADFPLVEAHERALGATADPQRSALTDSEPSMVRLLWAGSDRACALPSADSIRLTALPAAPLRRPVSPEGTRLKIGYLSSDFHAHATMRLLEDVLALHDREAFDITLFCHTTPGQEAWQRQHMPADLVSGMVRVGALDDEAAAAEIAARGIDILVDLKGHTMGARLGVVKRSDAPVKVTWLGYPGTVMGAGLDYAITDRIVTPDAAIPFFEEKLCRLPDTYQPNGMLNRPLPKPVSRREAGLPEGAFVFASFNAIQKITPGAFALWCRILKAVPHAVFWVFAERNEARANLMRAFRMAGIEEERIVFTSGIPYAAHVARLPAADLGLDSFPYNGHTTTSDMLWAGLPLLTMRGHAFQARVSESLLAAAGIDGLLAHGPDDFVARAVALAASPDRIAALKATIEQNRFRAPLFDSERFTRHLESAYRLMADRARQGLAPTLLDIPALPPRPAAFSDRSRG
ncbi:O-linked N-acetylglucosamine transferase, SPINDLY family protein [Gellertiella hungarica]|uniref:Putative O-linked N-acetylglucosamine transferase (SPINDLY family) n=1 Tax=Gellertiella hungarica TaxID=1572859 RepID=A0A7W6J4A0_9HYPH|nr:hypothetical protein [Gellertiella hungarica]MBB4064515.1 putative O-linked N-acetylglucosamine transferase (SPINDLY family) [Gellertiella hungarica]